MDEIVLRAIAKWPDVPAVYNWLRLDRRGNWLVKGERIGNAAVVDFIGRNYEQDTQQRWYFQNGPQRVFVTLAYTPLVYRLEPGADDALRVRAHTGLLAADVHAAWMDEHGDILVETELGPGLIVDRDLPLILERLSGSSGRALDDETLDALVAEPPPITRPDLRLRLGKHPLELRRIDSHAVPARFHFDPDPRPAAGEPDC
jgi:hypothetical protein